MEHATPAENTPQTQVYIKLFLNERKRQPKSPDFWLKGKTGEKKWIQLGAAWKGGTAENPIINIILKKDVLQSATLVK